MNTTTPNTATEREYRYALTGPEIEVAEIIRLAHLQAFSMAISHRDGTFTVRVTDTASRRFIEGSGPTFEDAWRSLPGAELGELTLGERIAARGRPAGAHLSLVETDR